MGERRGSVIRGNENTAKCIYKTSFPSLNLIWSTYVSLFHSQRTSPMATTTRQTLQVPHLGGTTVGYRLSAPSLDPTKPTVVLVNPFTATVDYYSPEFESSELTRALNLIAIEPLGHGATVTKSETWTYWDSALVSLQLLDSLDADRVFALGTSQGGWIVAQMALLAPARVCVFHS